MGRNSLHMNCGKAVYLWDYLGMLRGEKVIGRSSLIICSCSPSLTGSVAKDDPYQLCTSSGHNKAHRYGGYICPLNSLTDYLKTVCFEPWLQGGWNNTIHMCLSISLNNIPGWICSCWQNMRDTFSGIKFFHSSVQKTRAFMP